MECAGDLLHEEGQGMKNKKQETKTYDVDLEHDFVTQFDNRTVIVCNRQTKNQVAEYKVPAHVDCRDWSWLITPEGQLEISWIERHS